MPNGDASVPEPPPFEIYQTKISYGHDKQQVQTDVLGIKCAALKDCLLKEFFTQLGNPMNLEPHIGIFIPTSVVHMIGPEAYTNLLCDNSSFLQSITTVPIGDFQHEMLDIPFSYNSMTDIDSTTLYDTILKQPWCIIVECIIITNKVLLVTTKGQLSAA